MVDKKFVAILIVLLAVVVYFSMEKVDPLLARIDEFVVEVEEAADESKLGKALVANSLSKYFAESVYVNVPRYREEGELTRGEVKAVLMMVITSGRFSVNVVDPIVVARTDSTGSVEAVLKIERDGETHVNHVKIDMVYNDEEWLFSGCEQKIMLEK